MNLERLFELQAKLDERIIKEKGLEGEDLLPKKILALQVELGELANEARFFKFWSENQKPNIRYCHACNGQGYFDTGLIEDGMPYTEGCGYCEGTGIEENPLLEEYVDCLHFILSIGLELGCTFNKIAKQKSQSMTLQFIDLFHASSILFESIESDWDEVERQESYEELISSFIGLGEMLGFTWEQVEQAYIQKNQVNHARQEGGY